MADLVYPDAGLTQWLLNGISSAGINYHLFVNNVVIQNITKLTDLTECSNTGYSAINVNNTAFSTQTVNGHIGTVIAPQIVFQCTAGTQTVYGWYATDSSNTYLLAAQNLDQSVTFQLGKNIPVIPAFGFYSQLAF